MTIGNFQAKINVMCKNSIDKLKDTGKGGFNIRQKKISGDNSKGIGCIKGKKILGKLQEKKGVKSSIDVSENVRISSVCRREGVCD